MELLRIGACLVDALAGAGPSIHVAPATTDLSTAQRWFDEFEGAGLDGVIAKPLTITYQRDMRVMFKIKHERTADCVVAGYRVQFNRWRPDRDPRSCTYAQLEQPITFSLGDIVPGLG